MGYLGCGHRHLVVLQVRRGSIDPVQAARLLCPLLGVDRVRNALGSPRLHVLEAEGALGTAAVARALIRSARRGLARVRASSASAFALPRACPGMTPFPRRCAFLRRTQPAVRRTLAPSSGTSSWSDATSAPFFVFACA